MKTGFKHLSVILLCLALVLSITGCGSSTDTTGESGAESSSSTSSSSDGESILDIDLNNLEGTKFTSRGQADVEGYDLVADNSNYQLMIDPDTLTVCVKVKSTGYIWKSNLSESDFENSTTVEPTKEKYLSQILLNYYDSNNKSTVFTSYKDALLNNSEYSPTVALYSMDNGVRVAYKIGTTIDYYLLPDVLTVDTFNEICEKLPVAQRNRFENFYILNDYSQIDKEQQQAIASQYPLIKSENLYIIQSIAKTMKTKFVSEALRPIGWTVERVEEEYEKIGYNSETPAEANFFVTVEYTLDDNGLHVNVPADQIKYDDDNFHLYTISVLPYFGTIADGSDGYVFVPDGSGSLFNVKTETKNTVSLPFYGPDHTQWTKSINGNMKQAALPTFGVTNGDNSFVAYVDNGSGQGTIEYDPSYSDVTPYAHIGTEYQLAEFDTYLSNGMSNLSNLLKFASKPYADDITIDYSFLTGDKSNYVGMAEKVRDRIFSGKSKISDDTTKFYFETYGAVLRKETFVGYAYNATRALTTVDQCKEIYDLLRDGGVDNIAVRYDNLYGDKYENELSKVGNVSSAVGKAKDVASLAEYMSGNGDVLYPNAELVLEKNSGTLGAASTHARFMEGTLVTYSGGSSDIIQKQIAVPFTQIVNKSSTILSKIDDVMKRMQKLETGAVAFSTLGDTMFSDFEDNTVHREQVRTDTVKLLEKVSENNKIMVDVGNAYALPYVTDVTDIAMDNSGLYFAEESVPFMQIVTHGYVSYTGEALNLSDNYDMLILKSVEYGAGIRYIMNYAKPEMVKDTNYSDLYSTSYERWLDAAISDYKRVSEALDGTQSSVITGHERVSDGVYVTTYENGRKIAVNYSGSDVQVDGVTVGSMNFAVVSK